MFQVARPPTRWYVDGEMAVLFNVAYHYNEHFGSIPSNNDVFLSPRIFVGRRFGNGGSVRFTYRNLTEVGQLGATSEPSGDRTSGNSFTTNWFDLDYVTREHAPFTWWRVQYEAGVRIVYRREAYWNQSPYYRSDSSQDYVGVGPHFGLTSNWLLGQSGWAVYGRADTAITFGGGDAIYSYIPRQSNPWGWVESPRSERSSTSECQFDLGLQLGLSRRGEWRGRAIGLIMGVQADVISRTNTVGSVNSFGVVNVGPFLRCELGF